MSMLSFYTTLDRKITVRIKFVLLPVNYYDDMNYTMSQHKIKIEH